MSEQKMSVEIRALACMDLQDGVHEQIANEVAALEAERDELRAKLEAMERETKRLMASAEWWVL